ncbi:MAG: c-type cytochrome, partial [Acidobacteria bacterium]|nr:c-type cytochrome [Acidobacteriota bacterium]
MAIGGTLAQFGAAQSAPGAAPKTAEEVYKNIQVLKGVPADQLIPTMQFIAASLGTECELCHVEGAREKDEKKPKLMARQMMQMVFDINKNTFNGQREVTCYTCHRGSEKPVGIPIISDQILPPEPERVSEGGQANPAGMPAAEQLLDQ